MVIFGRFSLWLFVGLFALMFFLAFAVQHPVMAIAISAIAAILAIYAWRGRSTD